MIIKPLIKMASNPKKSHSLSHFERKKRCAKWTLQSQHQQRSFYLMCTPACLECRGDHVSVGPDRLIRYSGFVKRIFNVYWFRLLVSWLLIAIPWGGALYAHFWLASDQLWSVEQPFRQLTSVLMLALGMCASFALYCALFRGGKPR